MKVSPKGRPQKRRNIQGAPTVTMFSPRGKPGRPDEVHLTMDQFEAIRLADFEGYYHEEGAMALGVSRATFGRILKEAHRKVADALAHGKIIKIF